MHLVRIHVKPRSQHGSPSTIDPADPAAVAIRRAHGSTVSPVQVARVQSSIWQYLPFVGKVSHAKTYVSQFCVDFRIRNSI